MSTSKEVFTLRKNGQLDKAYHLAVQLNDTHSPGIWDVRAFCWCLVDIVERDISDHNYKSLDIYAQQLESIKVAVAAPVNDSSLLKKSTGSRLNFHDLFGKSACIVRPQALFETSPDAELSPQEDKTLISRRNRALTLVKRAKVKQHGVSCEPLLTYKDVYAMRKTDIDKAYKMALQLANVPYPDELELHALAWCLIDLIKRDFSAGNYHNLKQYGQSLQKIDACQNEVLATHQSYALLKCEPSASIIFKAQAYSKQGNYAEAVNCYRDLWPDIPEKHHTAFGWDIFRHCTQLHAQGQHTLPQVKKNLHLYLQLQVEKPSRLHSTVLWIAKKIAKDGHLDMGAFSRLWKLDSFREEDFKRSSSKDGRQYSALAEDVVQLAIKSATKSNNIEQIKDIVPFLDDVVNRYPDNQWLVYYKAKALVQLGCIEEALKSCKIICKSKSNEFWAWSLFGDAYGNDSQAALACYAKALLCPAEDDKTVKLRIKMAQLLAKLGHNEQAKYEISICMQLKPNNTSKEIAQLMSQSWFHETVLPSSNIEFYAAHAIKAEELLLAEIPWQDAVVGEYFTRPGKDGKPDQLRRKIYIKSSPFAREVTHPEKKFPYPKFSVGTAIRVKGEGGPDEPYKILAFAPRESNILWDILPSHIGVIAFVNTPKDTYHLLIARDVELFFNFKKIGKALREGDFVSVKISQSQGVKGKQYHVASVEQTTQQPSEKIYRNFGPESIRLWGEIGSTDSNIFIPQHLVQENVLADDDKIYGTAILSYNKKRAEWRWKALTIKKVSTQG